MAGSSAGNFFSSAIGIEGGVDGESVPFSRYAYEAGVFRVYGAVDLVKSACG